MLALLDLGVDNLLAYRLDGDVDAADVDRIFKAVDEKLSRHERLRVYAEVHQLSAVTPQALWRDLELSATRLSVLSRTERVALVTDLQWLRQALTLPNPLLSGIQLRVFSLSEQHLAQSWIRE
ncbi:MAG: STAS/SEC14 domain-containing protein [Gemmatimonadota bacterium]|nr:STAS/SEC14 domain-containing protein [Gemmatimonadota bacterium]